VSAGRMSATYGFNRSNQDRQLFTAWARMDPPDAWEQTRNQRIAALEGLISKRSASTLSEAGWMRRQRLIHPTLDQDLSKFMRQSKSGKWSKPSDGNCSNWKRTPRNSLPPSANWRERINAWLASSSQGMSVRMTNTGNAQSVREKPWALAPRAGCFGAHSDLLGGRVAKFSIR